MIRNPGYARWLKDNAREVVKTAFNWEGIARRTVSVYEQVRHERAQSGW